MQRNYILHLDNGGIAHMGIIDPNTTIELEIAKFDQEKGILVANNSLTGEQAFAKVIGYELME